VNVLEEVGLAAGFMVGIRSVANWRNLVLSARRFPDRAARLEGSRGFAYGAAPSLVDRVDALLCFHDAVGAGHASMLLSLARLLLGHVFRDATFLQELLASTSRGDGHTRRALVVALGLLGHRPAIELAVPDTGALEDWHAFVFALSLSRNSSAPAPRRPRRASAHASGRPSQFMDDALMKVEGGLIFSLLV
jgi:hypothetical protein